MTQVDKLEETVDRAVEAAYDANRCHIKLYAAITKEDSDGYEFIDSDTVSNSPLAARRRYQSVPGYTLVRVCEVQLIELEEQS